uniref:Major facilitator superfamily (MFS) profile domain-containing protein n=1 Tax=Strombidium rassoulzadegani TaxID=1082188 RepID=A0A7S3CTB9_9SPIT|mmetsp:Transcript_7920/g.13287  ORF Transcript_7920/g.13287 Transcript_7920/m.13287 type:complete len:223 (+) Transcript_7920:1551-2219(+)
MKNPTSRWVTLGGAWRFFEVFSVIYFLPSFYQQAFPDMKMQFGVINGLVQCLGGITSVMVSGIIGDRFEKRNKMTKAYIGIFGSLIGAIAMAGCCLFEGVGFYTSLAFLAVKFVASEGFMAPTITMMQRTVSPENQGTIVSAYLFFLTMAGCISTVLVGQLANVLGAASNPWIYGKIIYGISLIGYTFSIPCFWLAGKSYIAHLQLEGRKRAFEREALRGNA